MRGLVSSGRWTPLNVNDNENDNYGSLRSKLNKNLIQNYKRFFDERSDRAENIIVRFENLFLAK